MASVCKRWSRVISHSSLFWRKTCLSLSEINTSLKLTQPRRKQSAVRRRLTQWLKERSPLLETLLLMDCSHMHAELPSLLQALSSPALRMLRLDACAGEAGKVLKVVGGMTGLRRLDIDHLAKPPVSEGPLRRYRIRPLCALRHLEHLMLHVPRLEGGLHTLTSCMPCLQTLHVCTEKEYEFVLEGIGRLPRLREVTLTAAALGPLPLSATRLTSLTALNLSSTRCLAASQQGGVRGQATFWDTVSLLPALTALSSRHCDMHGSNLSRGVLAVTTLQSLELSSYLLNLPDLPGGALPLLRTLVFEGCSMLDFPPSWCSLPALHTLVLKSSPPQSLPEDMSRLTSLRDLTLEGGLSRTLLPCCALPALTRLRLARMDFLATLPSGPYLSSLQHLDLSGNRFLSVPPSLAHCRHLEELDLSLNSRLQLDPADVRDVFAHMPALRMLHLHKESALCDMGASPWDLRSVQALMQLRATCPLLSVCLDGSCRREASAPPSGSATPPLLPGGAGGL